MALEIGSVIELPVTPRTAPQVAGLTTVESSDLWGRPIWGDYQNPLLRVRLQSNPNSASFNRRSTITLPP